MNIEILKEHKMNKRVTILWRIVLFSIIIGFTLCALSCANKKQTLNGISRAIYESSNDYQEMKREPDSSLPSDQKSPSYEQYRKERDERLQKQDEIPDQE